MDDSFYWFLRLRANIWAAVVAVDSEACDGFRELKALAYFIYESLGRGISAVLTFDEDLPNRPQQFAVAFESEAVTLSTFYDRPIFCTNFSSFALYYSSFLSSSGAKSSVVTVEVSG